MTKTYLEFSYLLLHFDVSAFEQGLSSYQIISPVIDHRPFNIRPRIHHGKSARIVVLIKTAPPTVLHPTQPASHRR